MSYLDNGGRLYFESVNIGLDYSNTTFFDYFGITFLDDGIENEIITLKGGCYNCSENLLFYYLGNTSPHYSVDHLDANGGQLLLRSEDGVGRIFVNETENYKVISSSAIMGAIANGDTLNLKPYILSEFVNYFLDFNPVTSMHENIDDLVSGKSFPNPFAEETKIEVNITQTGWVTVDVYNINGQLIKRLKNEIMKPGNFQVTWDATDNAGGNVENGFYFYKITSGASTFSGKMVLLR